MKKWWPLGLLGVAGIIAGFALGATGSTGTVTACATSPAQTISANGVKVGTIAGKSACNTVTYTVSTETDTVTVTNAATTSPPTTTAPTTTAATTTVPPSSQAGNIFVSAVGSDTSAGCTRYATAQADPGGTVCGSFARACQMAQPGDTILVRNDGNYPMQAVANTDCPNASASAQITFLGETSGTPPVYGATADAPNIGGNCTDDCHSLNLEAGGNTYEESLGGKGTGGPNYVTFRNFRVQGMVEVAGNQGQTGTGTNGVGVVLDHISSGAIRFPGVTNILVTNSEFANCYAFYSSGTHPCVWAQSSDWTDVGANGGRQGDSGTFNHDSFHDYHVPLSTDHAECLFMLDYRAFTIENSQFYNCDVSGGIRIERITNPGPGDQLTIQNNWFGWTQNDSTDQNETCSGVTWGGNSGSLSNVLIRYNSFGPHQGPVGSSGSPDSTFRIVGNIIGDDPTWSCFEATPATGNYGSATVSGNVWLGHTYGANSVAVPDVGALYVNADEHGAADYHLASATSAPNNLVPCASGDAKLVSDWDGDPRPHDASCDAGSDEH